MISMRRRFGLLEFDDLELSPGGRWELLKLLSALERAGALRSEPGTFKALEGAVRGLGGFAAPLRSEYHPRVNS